MKKLFTLLLFVIAVTFANAQRSCDLRTNQYFPYTGSEIQNGKPFDITVKMKNLGPAAIKTTDTILYLLKIDGSYILSGGSPLGKAFYGLAIAVGDEVTQPLFAGLSLTFTTFEGTHQFCTEATLYNRSSSDGATDPSAANNTGCSSVLMNKFASGIEPSNVNSILISGIDIHPNPTTGNTLLNYIVAENNYVKIVVRDIQGREVMQVVNQKEAIGIYQNSVDLSSLNAGIYFVEYTSGDKVITSKLVKQ